ncbi:hypothetical protein SmJEL517_g02923 [Synchytrium microbalum]|uniref:diacylglycerol O-acyltransferase n=1 Tax=Synchytrium microbalum TaxID=1806994 RepID=A0A507CAF2_9FUNG|nr:uncharacterized protein SmJEL517_g02923 [Synchytrium microbalum]TPX34485.1 hypothetical protein SmJEL517_g02923 [Synchytrium microbalum]
MGTTKRSFVQAASDSIRNLVWSLYFDDAPSNGGRPFRSIRNLKVWHWLRDFFPITVVKVAELDPSRKYVFGYHPHGVISIGAWVTFATNALDIETIFPGVRFRFLTLSSNFNIPLVRDWILALGLASVSKESCKALLKKGLCPVIVVGGAAESLNAIPNTYDLVLKKRLGFIKLAIQTEGASLVPVFGFGENDVWEQVKDSRLRRWQTYIRHKVGFAPVLFHGRGIFNYNIGLLPYRKPITIVVGRPIHCPYDPNPTEAVLQKVHTQYLAGIESIWEEYKDDYAKDRKRELRIVE